MAFSWEAEEKKSKSIDTGPVFSWENNPDAKEEESYIDTLQNRINNYETRFNAAGVEAPAPKENKSWLLKTLDIIDRPRNAVVNAIQDVRAGENGALQGAWEGLTGKEHASVSDMIDPNMNKYVRAGLGFVGDVLLDPTTYLTMGAGGIAKNAAKEGAEALAKRNVLKFAGQEIADLTPIGNAIGNSALGKATAPLRQGIADTLQPIFNTRYVIGGSKMLPEEKEAIQGIVDNVAMLPQRIKGNQQIALDEIKQAWGGITPEAAEEATRIIESPDLLKVTNEGRQAANIAKQLTEQTGAKDLAAGVEFTPRDNYIKHLYKENDTAQALWEKYKKSYTGGSLKPNTRASFQKERKFDTYKDFEDWAAKTEGVRLTPVYDARILTAVREMEGVYKRASTAMYNDIAKAGNFVVQKAYDDAGKMIAPKGWVELPGVKQLKGQAVHPEVARHLERFNSTFNSDAGLRNLSNMVNSVQNVWKGLVTTSVPFHLRNELGNIYNNFLAGVVNPQIYSMAAGVQRGLKGTFTLGDKAYTSKDLLSEFRRQGLEGFGQFHGETLKTLRKSAEDAFGTNKLGLKNLNPVSQEFLLTKGSRYVGDKIETNAKLTHFIDRLAKGDTPEQAAESVRKYLFDYSDLTQAEQKIKAFVPFYTWTRKNLPLQLQSLVTQPGKPNALNHLVDNMQNTSGMGESDAPDWMKNEIAIPLWTKPDGTQVYLSPNLPISNLSIFGGGDTLRSGAGMLSPLIKAPIELAMNKQFFSRQPIEKYEGATANYGGFELPAKTAYALNQLGSIPRNIASIAEDIIPNKQEKSLLPAAPNRAALANVLLGSLVRDVNPERTKATRLIERDQQLADYRRLMEEVEGVKIPTMAEIKKSGGNTSSAKSSKNANKNKSPAKFSWE